METNTSIRPSVLFCLCLAVIALGGCLHSLPYEDGDQRVAAFHQRKENVALSFHTDKGRQVVFYIPPAANPAAPPVRLAILYPGIESVALGWQPFIHLEDDPHTGYLLIDYPSRGFCEGMLHPGELYKNTDGALAALANHLKVKAIDAELCLLGHSFGSGAALQFAAKHDVERIVLVAPYNNLKKAVSLRSSILAWLMPAQIDNVAIIKTLLGRNPCPEIIILHGKKDASLPVEMGRELYQVDTDTISYHEIPQGGHSNILSTHRDLIFHSLLGLSDVATVSE